MLRSLRVIKIVEDLSVISNGGRQDLKFSNAVGKIMEILGVKECSVCCNKFEDEDLYILEDGKLYCSDCKNKIINN